MLENDWFYLICTIFIYSKFPAHFLSPIYIDGIKKKKYPEVFCEIGLINWYQCAYCANVQYIFVMPYSKASSFLSKRCFLTFIARLLLFSFSL